MTNITVAEFANELKRPADTLMEQLQAAGVPKQSASDALTDADKATPPSPAPLTPKSSRRPVAQ